MRPNLSVNLGLRYALQPAFYALNNSYSGAHGQRDLGRVGLRARAAASTIRSARLQHLQAGHDDRQRCRSTRRWRRSTQIYNTD